MGIWANLWLHSAESDRVFEAIEAMDVTLRTDSDHVAPVRTVLDTFDDMFTVRVHCHRCGKVWSRAYLMPVMLGRKIPGSGLMVMGEPWAERWIRSELIPLGAEIMRDDCDSMVGRQQVQELVIEWLTSAGADGLPYSRVLGRLILLELGELDAKVGIAGAIKALELEHRLVGGTAYLFLPDGHPNRDW